MVKYNECSDYLMGDNVKKIIKLFKSQSVPMPEGEFRNKDLQAAADLLGEPLFVSKGKDVFPVNTKYSKIGNHSSQGKIFEKNLLLDFTAVRDMYMKLLNEAISSLNEKEMFYKDFKYSHFIDSRFEGFVEHIDYYYHAFYPHSTEEIKDIIKYVVKELWEVIKLNYIRDIYNEDGEIECNCSITEKVFWLASTYTREFVDALQNEINVDDEDELDVDSALSHKGVTGIKIDEDKNTIEFYAWLLILDIKGSFTKHYKYVAEVYEQNRNNDIDNDYIGT